jgi:hypothetical protein
MRKKLVSTIVILLLAALIAAAPSATIVYITKSGSKYHADGCRYLSKSKIEISLGDAVARGLTPCSVCNPPVLDSKK